MNQPSVPRSVPGPASMSAMRSAVDHHANPATTNSSATMPSRARTAAHRPPCGTATADALTMERLCSRREARVNRSVRQPDAPVEPGRRVDVQHANGDVAVVTEAMLDIGRGEHERARRRRHLAVAEDERHLALEDVERIVLAVVGVLLELAPCGDLDDLDVEPRRVDGPGEELDVAQPMPLTERDDDRVGRHGAAP